MINRPARRLYNHFRTGAVIYQQAIKRAECLSTPPFLYVYRELQYDDIFRCRSFLALSDSEFNFLAIDQ